MSKKEINRILYISAGLIFLSIFILSIIGVKIFTIDGFKKIPTIISGVVFFWTFYFSFGWKLPIIKKMVYKEDLNGTWFGTYTSKDFTTNQEYKGEIAVVIRQTFLNLNIKSFTDKYLNYSFGERSNYDSNKIPAELSIKQTFFNIQIGIKTNESKSRSIGANFDIDEERGLAQLFYSYLNTPKSRVRARSEIHFGSARLEFDNNHYVHEMDGEYWTSRETTREINMKKKNEYGANKKSINRK